MMLTKHCESIIDAVTFNLKFIPENELKYKFKNHFRVYSYLLPCKQDNVILLQDTADRIRDYFNNLYDTTMYDYDPLENYRMNEKETINDINTRNENFNGDSNQIPTNWKTTVKNGGYGVGDELAETSETIQSGNYDTKTANNLAVNGKDDTTRNLLRYGNIGVQTSQDMIQKQRDILIQLLTLYFDEFANCFRIEL